MFFDREFVVEKARSLSAEPHLKVGSQIMKGSTTNDIKR